MARVNKGAILGMAHAHWESYHRSRNKAISLDAWQRGDQYDLTEDSSDPFFGRPYSPRETTEEHDDLARRTPTPWAGLVVTSLAQTAYVDGVRMPGKLENMRVWEAWERNRMGSRQASAHRGAIGHGHAYGLVLPGRDALTGDKMPKMLLRSAKRMASFYEDESDEWPMMAMEAKQYRTEDGEQGWNVTVYDEVAEHRLTCKWDGRELKDWSYIDYEEHPFNVPPVARLANRLDLDGKTTGEIEPVIPLLQRIDQDTFDRLIVQRFGAWKVRYISGMAKPSTAMQANLQALKLKIEDLLISSNPETKFGTLDSTPLDGFISVNDADLRMLAAITQTPPHHLLGLSSNLQAEALAAAESGLQRKSHDFKMNAAEFHEQMFRMAAHIMGESAEARAFDMQVRWRDTESRSLTQAADALGKLAVQLKVPVEMLWERVPGWTDSDTERAKELIEQGGVDQLLAELFGDQPGGDMNTDQAAQSGNDSKSE